MKSIERLIIKLIIIQFICLVCSQFLLTWPKIAMYLTKIQLYEGVTKQVNDHTEEVFQQINR